MSEAKTPVVKINRLFAVDEALSRFEPLLKAQHKINFYQRLLFLMEAPVLPDFPNKPTENIRTYSRYLDYEVDEQFRKMIEAAELYMAFDELGRDPYAADRDVSLGYSSTLMHLYAHRAARS